MISCHSLRAAGVLALSLALAAPAARAAEEPVLNLYSARHYQTDEALYDNFTKATGIRINRIEAGDDQLLERIRSEGAQSPADILLIVDAARLWSAQEQGLFQPVKSKVLDERIPASMRSSRARWRSLMFWKSIWGAARPSLSLRSYWIRRESKSNRLSRSARSLAVSPRPLERYCASIRAIS